jgi:flagellar basal body-associated protein FliL
MMMMMMMIIIIIIITDTVHIYVVVMSSSEHTAPSVQEPAGAPTSARARPKPEITFYLQKTPPPHLYDVMWQQHKIQYSVTFPP